MTDVFIISEENLRQFTDINNKNPNKNKHNKIIPIYPFSQNENDQTKN